jgi:hypothetical protein
MNEVREAPLKRKNLSHLFTGTVASVTLGAVGSLILNCVKWHVEGYPAVMSELSALVTRESQSITIAPTWVLFAFEWTSSVAGMICHSLVIFFEEFSHQRGFFEGATPLEHRGHELILFAQRFIHVFGFVLWISVLKVLSILSAFWLFVFSSLIGSLDGLLSRYIRTSEGGRESAFFFHHVSDVLLSLPALVFFGVLIVPFFISPVWVKSLLAMLLFIFFHTQASSLKKFL